MLTPHTSFLHGLRSAVLDGAPASPLSVDLSRVWGDVASGHERVIDGLCSEDRCFLILQPRTPPGSFQLPGTRRNIRILERVLLGQAQKAIALDLDLAASTVAFSVAECLGTLGLERRVCRVPMLLVAAVHAMHGLTTQKSARLDVVQHADCTYQVLSSPRPDTVLRRLLSPAEYVVARLLVEGLTHAEIAATRGASARTVANQLATAFQKLGVSGRSELLCAVLRGDLPVDARPKPWSVAPRARWGASCARQGSSP